MDLFDQSELEPQRLELGLNKDFAKRYEYNKQRQELQKLQEKYGDMTDESSTHEEEDENGEEATPEADSQILKTIAAIRNRDSRIYDAKHNFFDESAVKESPASVEGKESPLTISEYNRHRLLNGVDSDEKPDIITHAMEQRLLKDQLKQAINVEVKVDQDDFFTAADPKPVDVKAKEDDEYKKWLLETLKNDKNSTKALGKWLESGKQDSSDDAFLMNYVLNRGWMDSTGQQQVQQDIDDDEDMDEFEKSAEFENSYNFRYEELEHQLGTGVSYTSLGKSLITGHSRQQIESVRRKDSHRIYIRKSREERLQAEKELKMNEIKRLKLLKTRQVEEMCGQVVKVAGASNKQAIEKLLENGDEDFDSEQWDQTMQKIFDDAYYKDSDEKMKPEFSDNESETMEMPRQVPVEEQDFKDETTIAEEDRVNVKAPQAKEMLKVLLKEYDSLHFEDVKGGLKTRFKYRKVEGDSFGLEMDELINADDDLLNEYVSLKKLAPYRSDDRHRKWLKKFKQQCPTKKRQFKKKLKNRIKSQKEDSEVKTKKQKTEKKKFNPDSRLEAFGL